MEGTAADVRRVISPGATASGLASATQLVDMTPFASFSFGQTAGQLDMFVREAMTEPPRLKLVPESPYAAPQDDEPMLRLSSEAIEDDW